MVCDGGGGELLLIVLSNPSHRDDDDDELVHLLFPFLPEKPQPYLSSPSSKRIDDSTQP